jgi:hypothetical protein
VASSNTGYYGPQQNKSTFSGAILYTIIITIPRNLPFPYFSHLYLTNVFFHLSLDKILMTFITCIHMRTITFSTTISFLNVTSSLH